MACQCFGWGRQRGIPRDLEELKARIRDGLGLAGGNMGRCSLRHKTRIRFLIQMMPCPALPSCSSPAGMARTTRQAPDPGPPADTPGWMR